MKTNDKEDAPHKSPRDFRPWEKLVAFYKPVKGVFMYQLAASQIAEAEGWSDSQMEALEAEMRWAILNGLLPQRSRKTGMVIDPDVREKLMLVTVNDVNKWLEKKLKDDDVKYQWKLQSFATQPQPQPMPSPAQNAADPTLVMAATGAPPLKQRSQEARILELLKAQGYDPKNLSIRIQGKPGSKAKIRKLALTEAKLFTSSSFDKAWERLRNAGEIADEIAET